MASRKRKKKKPEAKRVQASTTGKLRKLAAVARDAQCRERELGAILRRFHNDDVPAYEKWIKENFRSEYDKLEALQREIDDQETLLAEADYAYHTGLFKSKAEALEALEREGKEAQEIAKTRIDDTGDEDFSDESPEEMPDEVIDVMFRLFMAEARDIDVENMDPDERDKAREDFVATLDHAKKGNQAAFGRALRRVGSNDGNNHHAEVKSFYRRLAKRLHPDHQGDLSEIEKQLWDETSLYYQALDLLGLKEIDIALTLERGEEVEPGQAIALKRYQSELLDRIARAEYEIDGRRHEPEWEFALKKKTKSIVTITRKEFVEALAESRDYLRSLRGFITNALRSLKKKPRAKKRPKTRAAKEKVAAAQTEFEF